MLDKAFFSLYLVQNFRSLVMVTIKLFLKNLLISMMTAGIMYQVGLNDYIDFPKEYPKDYIIFAFSIAFCAFLMTYNQQQDKKNPNQEPVKNQ